MGLGEYLNQYHNTGYVSIQLGESSQYREVIEEGNKNKHLWFCFLQQALPEGLVSQKLSTNNANLKLGASYLLISVQQESFARGNSKN